MGSQDLVSFSCATELIYINRRNTDASLASILCSFYHESQPRSHLWDRSSLRMGVGAGEEEAAALRTEAYRWMREQTPTAERGGFEWTSQEQSVCGMRGGRGKWAMGGQQAITACFVFRLTLGSRSFHPPVCASKLSFSCWISFLIFLSWTACLYILFLKSCICLWICHVCQLKWIHACPPSAWSW